MTVLTLSAGDLIEVSERVCGCCGGVGDCVPGVDRVGVIYVKQ